MIKYRRKLFLHTDRTAPAAYISSQGRDLADMDHCNRFLSHRARRLFEVQRLCNRDHENVMLPTAPHSHQRFEYRVGVTAGELCDRDAVNRLIPVRIIEGPVGDFLLFKYAHRVGFLFLHTRSVYLQIM